MEKPSIYTIAEMAGVSTATVSRALSGKGGIRPDTRQRILDVAAQLNYRPSQLARRLSASDITIGVLYSGQQLEEFGLEIFRGAYDAGQELADYLKKEGYQVTQATISRDIRELKLTKIATNDGRQKYALMQPHGAGMNEKYLRVLKDGFISMDMAQNILVIKTVSGMAMAVAAAIDAMHWSEVAGCIAGDDTIMCAIRSTEDTLRVMDKISRIVGRQ